MNATALNATNVTADETAAKPSTINTADTAATVAALADRLATVERALRRTRGWVVVMFAAAVVACGGAAMNKAEVPEEIRAKRFVVDGSDGENIGVFGRTKAANDPILILMTNDQKKSFAVSPTAKRIMFTTDGKPEYIE